MRTVFKSIIIAAAISVCSLAPKSSVAQDQPVTLQTFYDQLTPYGQWMSYPGYGYVFLPNVGPGFIPYSTAGHWAYTEQYGWTWASDYAWGWACFHYGRWNYDPSYGWFWVPDTQWGPAWVVWRNSDQYYGWAPLPSGVDINFGINDGYGISPDHWCFVPNQYFGDPYISRYYMPRGNNDIFIRNSAVIIRMNYDHDRRYNYFAGPDRNDVERFHREPIQPIFIRPDYGRHDDNDRHDNDRHDDGRHDDNNRHDYVPARAVRVEDVPQRDANHQHGNYNRDNGGDHRGDNHDDNHGDNRGNGHR